MDVLLSKALESFFSEQVKNGNYLSTV